MTIQIFGTGCPKCNLMEKQAKEAVLESGLEISVEKVTDLGQIANLGIMMLPAFAIDKVVKTTGKVLTKDQILAFIRTSGLKMGRV